MLGVRWGYVCCAARQGVHIEYLGSRRVYVFTNFSCLCSLRYAFQPHSKLCVPSHREHVFYVPQGQG